MRASKQSLKRFLSVRDFGKLLPRTKSTQLPRLAATDVQAMPQTANPEMRPTQTEPDPHGRLSPISAFSSGSAPQPIGPIIPSTSKALEIFLPKTPMNIAQSHEIVGVEEPAPESSTVAVSGTVVPLI
jgi:hypothetical protein